MRRLPPSLAVVVLCAGAASPSTPDPAPRARPGPASGPPVQDEARRATWTSLPLPSICRQPAAEVGPAPLWDGRHVVVDPRADAPQRIDRRAYRMPLANVIEVLEGDALRRGAELRFHRPAPPLLARGAPADLDAARAVIEALDAVGDAHALELTATLVPGFDGSGPAISASPPPADLAARDGARTWSRTVRSGDVVVLGERRGESFLAGFDVQVAAGSEAPDPVFGRVHDGDTLHLRAWRVADGSSLYVEGLLDLARASRAPDFDPGAPDLGRLEKPEVRIAQVAFSGEVPSGGALRVALRGAPLAEESWTLHVGARTAPDPDVGWTVRDVALLESPMEVPPLPHPGVGIAPGAAFARPASALEPLTASALWGEVELALANERTPGARPRRPLLAYAPGLLVGPAENGRVWEEARALARAAEGARTRSAALRLASGEVEAVLPVSSGAFARVLVATERLYVTDYRLEIAPESWIAAPVVESALDGFVVQGRLDGEGFPCAWWSAASTAARVLDRADTAQGAVERVRRTHRAGRAAPRLGEAPMGLSTGGAVPALRISLAPR